MVVGVIDEEALFQCHHGTAAEDCPVCTDDLNPWVLTDEDEALV